MKVHTTKYQMRFIIDDEWWRIRFKSKGKPAGIDHRCDVSDIFWWDALVNKRWVDCIRPDPDTQRLFYAEAPTVYTVCANCGMVVPLDVLADARMLGIQARLRTFMDDIRNPKTPKLPEPTNPWETTPFPKTQPRKYQQWQDNTTGGCPPNTGGWVTGTTTVLQGPRIIHSPTKVTYKWDVQTKVMKKI